jgi:broad specificity polyphosphatase/5'/3'-nucleotidase SurE
MKVLFTFGGIPHYLNAMLNRLQAKGVEITVVSPKKGNTTIGKGVKMVEGGTYKHLTTPEKKMFYGKSAFPALPEIIAEEKPDIVVVGWLSGRWHCSLSFRSSTSSLNTCRRKSANRWRKKQMYKCFWRKRKVKLNVNVNK